MHHHTLRRLTILFGLSVTASALHYIDNIMFLDIYPDLPTTTVTDIAAFGITMLTVGLLGFWLYDRKHTQLAYLAWYMYSVMNMAVLGHYLPSRLDMPILELPFRIHFLILLELATLIIFFTVTLITHIRLWNRSPLQP